MSEKDLNSPDERYNAVSKGNTRELMAGERNRKKPEDIRLKDETNEKPDEDEEDQ